MDTIRARTHRNIPLTVFQLIDSLNPVIRGWGNYFRKAHVRKRFNRLQRWIIRRIWSHRFKRWRNTGWKKLPESSNSYARAEYRARSRTRTLAGYRSGTRLAGREEQERTWRHLSITPWPLPLRACSCRRRTGSSASTRPDWKQAGCQLLSVRSGSGEKFVFKSANRRFVLMRRV
ncbi:group II intron maturase-specific domain-containing protein [Paenibacillus thiaminolyticus]|uniref:group II intron maturase-specific domain-containing protein n=1 Tax=Paenibacillus thiaminolyticus TaxID=49283 RepID=UPI003D2C52A6